MMGSEIAIGHSYVRGGDIPAFPHRPADCSARTSPSRTAATRSRASTTPKAGIRICVRRSPAPGVDVSRRAITSSRSTVWSCKAPDNIYRLLDGTANRQTVLTVNSRPSDGRRAAGHRGSGRERAGLRTRAWVEANRRMVDKLSGGKLAYVYLPNTGQPGYTSFNRYYFAQQDKQGAVIDERYNGGGSAADYIIDVLQRDFDGYFNNVAGDRYPFTSPVGRNLGTEGDDHQ